MCCGDGAEFFGNGSLKVFEGYSSPEPDSCPLKGYVARMEPNIFFLHYTGKTKDVAEKTISSLRIHLASKIGTRVKAFAIMMGGMNDVDWARIKEHYSSGQAFSNNSLEALIACHK